MNVKREYTKKREMYKKQLDKLNHKSNVYGNLRLLVIFIGVTYTVWSYSQQSYLNSFNSLVITLLVFSGLVIVHQRINTRKIRIKALYKINDRGIRHLRGEWDKFQVTGEEFIDENHDYSWDFDIFGKHSLFQWINHTNTPIGKEKLKNALIKPVKSSQVIINRQKAVKELATSMDWVQEFRASGMIENQNIKNEEPLINWSKEVNTLYLNNKLGWLVRILPIISLITLTLAYLIPSFSYVFGIISVSIQVVIAITNFGKRHKMMDGIGGYREQIRVYEQMIKHLEGHTFQSDFLNVLQNQMIYQDKETASKQIKKLDGIMDMVSLRRMQFYILFNIITLWDYHCVIALENWKHKYGKCLTKWLDSLGEMEALSSIGTIAYEQPDWVMPTIVKDKKISGYEIGHPLIHENDRVCNNITFGGRYTALLVTGSNMSGKSTFLRTIGINLVLAYAGAPVCAKSFSCPIMEIYTSMRVSDDIDNKISSFYAELLRIKKIIQATKQGKTVFFLLDEIFKGTNSRDRHIGAKTLIKKLYKEDALGLVSTHDLELADMALEENSKIKNYHFQEYYKDNKIFFDYRLYPGVTKTFNAIYLMNQIGIEID